MSKVNPSIKAVTVLICGLFISFSYSPYLNGYVIITCLILMAGSGVKWTSAGKILIPATLAAASLFFSALFHTNPDQIAASSTPSVHNAVQLELRIYAYSALGMLFALTTDSEEFIYSLMHQLKLPPKFAYGVLAAYHLLPAMKREYASVRLAYKIKGYHLSPFSLRPVFSMLVNTMHWSENVAMAMESKGFDGDGPRSYFLIPEVRWFDKLFFIGYTGGTAVLLFLFPHFPV